MPAVKGAIKQVDLMSAPEVMAQILIKNLLMHGKWALKFVH